MSKQEKEGKKNLKGMCLLKTPRKALKFSLSQFGRIMRVD